MPRGQPPTLRARAVAWLAQRDHSERELRGKLLRWLQARGDGSHPGPGDAVAAVEEVLAWLRERNYLDDQRFVATRVDARAERFGLARITHELAQLGVTLAAGQADQLRASEVQRAQALWDRRFGQPAADPREAARQARFLAGRGFSGEVVRQVLRESGRRAGVPGND